MSFTVAMIAIVRVVTVFQINLNSVLIVVPLLVISSGGRIRHLGVGIAADGRCWRYAWALSTSAIVMKNDGGLQAWLALELWSRVGWVW
jgi:hypothetical protein